MPSDSARDERIWLEGLADPDFTGPFFMRMEQSDRQHINPLQRLSFEATLWCCRHCGALIMDRSKHQECPCVGEGSRA